ncbi:MAG: hypothetical protein U0414_05420 [Polyangiaceae bacterium]
MSLVLLITCAIAASASATGFALGRRRWRRSPQPAPGPSGAPAPNGPEGGAGQSAPAPQKESIDMETHALALGGLGAGEGRERWLAGGIIVFDGPTVAAGVFFAPEGSALEVVAAFPEPRRSILWLSPVEVEIGHDAPTALEIQSVLLQRKRRLPVQLKRAGQGAPDLGSTALLAEYAAVGGDAALVLRTPERTYGWFGREVAHPDYDRMGKGA